MAWAEEFAKFTPMHGLCVAVLGSAMGVSSGLGARWRGTVKERRLRLAWAWTMLTFVVAVDVWLLTARFDPYISYPLHVCDIMGLVSCIALLVRVRWLATMTVFWGLALCTQAFFTPILTLGPAYLHFWFFWLSHTAIVGSAVYLIAVDRYRPTLQDLGLACLLLSGYIGWVLPLDIAYGWNYAYVGNVPVPEGTILEKLGEWPGRVYWLGLLACGGMGLVYLGFQVPGLVARVLGRGGRGAGMG